jgi:hypothetical protein
MVDSASHKVLLRLHRSGLTTEVRSLIGDRRLIEVVTRLGTRSSEMPSPATIEALPISGVLH